MKTLDRLVTLATVSAVCLWVTACGGSGGGGNTTGPAPYITSFTATPTTVNYGQSTSLTGVFSGGTGVITPGDLAATSGAAVSVSPTATGKYTLTVTAPNGTQATATATVTVNPIITVTPSSTVIIGTQQQFTATAGGFGTTSTAVNWSVSAPSGSSLSAGDISSTGLYNTPYPAPPTVTVTATSTALPSVSGSVTITLSSPAAATGPALTVDVNTPNTPSENPHAISPYVYGVNAYALDSASQTTANPSITRWGGDNTSRYNYLNGWSNSAADWYFENGQGTGMPGDGTFNSYVATVHSGGASALGTVPVNGWVSNGQNACGYPQSLFPNQVGGNGNPAFTSYNNEQCGWGLYPDGVNGCTSSSGCAILVDNTTADPTAAAQEAEITSVPAPPPDITDPSTPAPGSSPSTMAAWANSTWTGGWVNSLVNTSGIGPGSNSTGVQVWDLDNEPTWWSATQHDVHPYPFTYDEVTNHGIGTALAVKAADPSAQVSGPVIDWWWGYFYSMQDIWNGWDTGPCYEPWSDPTDRQAHGGVPLIEYYLQQFNKYSQQYGVRLLDYVDIHGYFAASYNGSGVGLTTAGDTQEQVVRLNSTRVFWDPTYTDPNYTQPNYTTDPNYTSNCTVPLQSPQLIPMLRTWVANDYPGTKTAIDEYNFGGLESINGAVVQADILGIFGREGLDLGAFWPTQNYNQQIPGNYAFAMYRNCDGKDSMFGDIYLSATSSASGSDAEGQLAVYGAQRSSDNAITVMVINKTYGSLTSTLSLANFAAANNTTAQVYQYSNTNINAITSQTPVTVTPPAGGSTSSTISYTFPGQSITLLVIPQ
jgi:hypothetical protein